MNNLIRYSRSIFSNAHLIIARTSATTSSSSGGTNVRSSGASTNLSQASRAGDGTDMAMRDAEQRANQTDSTQTKPKQPKTESDASTYAQIGLAIALVLGAFYSYRSYQNSSNMLKNANINQQETKQKYD